MLTVPEMDKALYSQTIMKKMISWSNITQIHEKVAQFLCGLTYIVTVHTC